ncbi:MAG: MFS transporter [Microbacteriaceae bacterium]
MNSATSSPFPFFRLLVITGAIFIAITSEFLPTGLLPDISGELRVSESQVGLLVTVFAGTVVVTTAPFAFLTRTLSRKWLMVGLLVVFAISNFLAAGAPTYEVLVASRVLGGLAHGLFWAVTGPYASHLVPPHQLARAVAVTGMGGTAAFIFGVPLGTAIGHAIGWRLAFVAVGVAVLVFVLLVVLLLPPVKHLPDLSTAEIALPMRKDPSLRGVIVVCAAVLIIMTGQNVFYTYIAPWVIQVGGFSPDAVSPLLLVYGVAGAAGLLVVGTIGDKYPRATPVALVGMLALAVAFLAAVGPTAPWAVIAGLALWSAAFGGLPALFQARLLHEASARVRDVAAAWLTTAFNIAIGGGALIGGAALDGFGIQTLPWIQVAVVVVGLVFVSATLGRRAPARATVA